MNDQRGNEILGVMGLITLIWFITLIAVFLALFVPDIFGQDRRDPKLYSESFNIRQPGKAAADTSFSPFASDSTDNDTSAVYRVWPLMSLIVNTTSSGTPDYNVDFQVAAYRKTESCADAHTVNWVTHTSTNVGATGYSYIALAAGNPIPVGCWRVVIDGQASNDPTTAVPQIMFTGINPYRK